MKRRNFLAATPLLLGSLPAAPPPFSKNDYPAIDEAAARPVLRREWFPDPVMIEQVELLRYEDNFLCRVRTTDGAEGISVSNNMQMQYLYPIQVLRINPFFVGKDARDLEQLLEEIYTYKSNYKLQSLALWVPLATVEFAILDLLGQLSGKSMGELISDRIYQPKINVYQANNNRGKSAEESLESIITQVERSGAKAVKFKIAGRMNDPDTPEGRSERLIPMVREHFGSDMTVYADANGGYDVENAIRVGKILADNKIDFYEEPIPFDWYQELKKVKGGVDVPLAGGEQEPSMRNFRYLIGEGILDIVQPDPFYFGGMIRSARVARMAAAVGKTCVPHISGSGIGPVYMAHFVASLPNAGPYHEYKFTPALPISSPTSSLKAEDGQLTVPTGPGSGILIDPDYVKKHRPLSR